MRFKFNLIHPFCLLGVILVLSGCKSMTRQAAVAHIQPIVISAQEPLLIPGDSLNPVFNGLDQKKSVLKYYQKYGQKPGWLRNGNYSVFADSMIYFLRHVQYYGFRQGGYHLVELESTRPDFSNGDLIRKEILLTDAFFSLSENLKFGICNSRPGTEDSLQIMLLSSTLENGNIRASLESQEPALKGYTSLKEGLRLMLDSAKTQSVDSISLEENIRLISLNLERWRAENANISSRYIFVNIPSFNLDVVENDSIVLSSKVIVGTPETETPVLSSVVECFSIYPYWNVPRKISIKEYLPVIKSDSAFVSRNNFDVLDRKGNVLNPDSVEWNKFHENYFPVVLRQREGPENALGIIKFIFDNPYAVYLHDTSAKRLFRNNVRAFSHGCIRMEKAVDLAHYLVTGVVGRESKNISKYLQEKTQRRINLAKPIPIHIRYFTCEFKNSIFFRYSDIYGRDQELYDLVWNKDKVLGL